MEPKSPICYGWMTSLRMEGGSLFRSKRMFWQLLAMEIQLEERRLVLATYSYHHLARREMTCLYSDTSRTVDFNILNGGKIQEVMAHNVREFL